MNPFRKIAAFAALALCSACTTASLEELRRADPTGSAFQQALAMEYRAFSESEAKQYDWVDMDHFAEKGLLAIYGGDAQPEPVANWNIPVSMQSDFETARARLLAALTEENKTSRPQLAARAQYFYDCWIEQQEENWQVADIAACRDGFFAAIEELQGDSGEAPVTVSTSRIVFFQWNKASFTADGLRIIGSVIEELLSESGYEIILNGHADRSGSDEYNMSLSQQRVQAVRDKLVEGGVNNDVISEFAFGETDPKVMTKDGVRERSNRRVEIFINP